MGAVALLGDSTGWILGWTLAHSLWQGALVAGGLALVLRFVPGGRERLRSAAAWGALLLLVGLTAATWVLVETEWRGHVACWESADLARTHPELCASHAVPVAHELLGEGGKERAVSPLAWARRMSLPVPASVRTVSLAATGGVALVALISGTLALASLLRFAIGLSLLRGILRRARPLRAPRGERLLARLGGELGVEQPVGLLESDEIPTPAVAGWRRPAILFPTGLADLLSPEQLADVLAHELVHVRERHFLVNLGQRALDCLCVFNPFALWISRRIREEREVHCDRVAAGPPACGRRRYVETLLELEHLRGPASPALIGLLGEGSLLRRIRRLSEAAVSRDTGRAPGRARRTVFGAVVALATVLVVIQFSLTMVSLTSWSVMSHDIELRRAAVEAAASVAVTPET